MSSDSDEQHERFQPIKRYRQFENAAVNLHPRTLKRWESKIDFSLNAELLQITSRKSEVDQEITRNISNIGHDVFGDNPSKHVGNKIHNLHKESPFEASLNIPSSSSMFQEDKMEDHINSSDNKNITRNLLSISENSLLSDDSFSSTTDFNDDELSDSSHSIDDDNDDPVLQQFHRKFRKPGSVPQAESNEKFFFLISQKLKSICLQNYVSRIRSQNIRSYSHDFRIYCKIFS